MKPKYKRMLAGLERKAQARGRKKKEVSAWVVYILRCGDGSLYTGISNDLDRRVVQHQAGRGARYTATHPPVELVFHEIQPDRSAALIREARIKSLSRPAKEKLIAGAHDPT